MQYIGGRYTSIVDFFDCGGPTFMNKDAGRLLKATES